MMIQHNNNDDNEDAETEADDDESLIVVPIFRATLRFPTTFAVGPLHIYL